MSETSSSYDYCIQAGIDTAYCEQVESQAQESQKYIAELSRIKAFDPGPLLKGLGIFFFGVVVVGGLYLSYTTLTQK